MPLGYGMREHFQSSFAVLMQSGDQRLAILLNWTAQSCGQAARVALVRLNQHSNAGNQQASLAGLALPCSWAE